MTNLAKAIYFLSLMSCSINKLKAHVKILYFPILCGKKYLLQEMVVVEGELRPPCPSFPYDPVLSFWIVKKSWPFLMATLIPNILKGHIRESNFVRTFYCEWNLKSFTHFPNYWKIYKILNFPLGKFSHRKIFLF